VQRVDEKFPLYRAALCGLLAMLVGIGVARFGYAPLVPALVGAGWFSASAAFWLGAVNLLGYLLGAWGMRSWTGRVHARLAVVGMMGATAVGLGASAWDGGVVWYGIWRLVSGVTGGALMVLMAAAVTGRAPATKRGQVGGITFAGMGVGIMLSALVIPRLLPFGLPATWGILAGMSVVATVVVAVAMPDAMIHAAPARGGERTTTRPVLLLMVSYGFCALAFVPHMLFLASFSAIGLHRGVAAGAATSAALGLAAAVGPPVLGRVADRLGFLPTLTVGYFVMALAVALPLLAKNQVALEISAFGVGGIGLGTVMLTSGALSGLVPAGRLSATWGAATITYALAQALAAAGFSQLFHATGSFLLLFGIGTAAALVSGICVWGAGRRVA
jgi:predicted MFS family arabinose efflux permease